MKLRTFEALHEHLEHRTESCTLSLVVGPGERERKAIVEQLGQALCKNKSQVLVKSSLEAEEAFSFLSAASLFGEERLALGEIERSQLPLLVAYARSPASRTHLILGMEPDKKPLLDLEKEGILLLDLSAEKAKEKEQRHLQFVSRFLSLSQKSITPAAALVLIQRTDLDLGLLEQEVAKLLCFVGERDTITEEDLQAICVKSQVQMGGFKLAEMLIQGTYTPPYLVRDSAQLLMLLPQLRYLFETGLKLTSRIEKGENVFDRNVSLMSRRKPLFFKRALLALFQLELGVKQSLATPQLLFDRFCAEVCEAP